MIDIKVIILVGASDFGRCPLGSRLNRALWPVFGKPVLQRSIDYYAARGIRRFVVCCQNRVSENISASLKEPANSEIVFVDDPLPRGPAGCIRDAADFIRDDLLLVLPAALMNPPDPLALFEMHSKSDSPMSLFIHTRENGTLAATDCAVYLCSKEAIRAIPEKGFGDIKEGLIRELARQGKPARALYLANDTGSFRNWQDYLHATARYLDFYAREKMEIEGYTYTPQKTFWTGPDTVISPAAKTFGPVVIGENSVIGDDVVLYGPTVIGRNVHIGSGTIIRESVVWDNAVIGPQTSITASLIDSRRLRPNRNYTGLCIVPATYRTGLSPSKGRPAAKRYSLQKQTASGLSDVGREPVSEFKRVAVVFSMLLLVLLWTYWPTIGELWSVWLRSDEYSSGLLVPFVALYILWSRRKSLRQAAWAEPSSWGLFGLAAAQAVRWFGFYYQYDCVERLSLVLSLGGLILMLPGVQVFKKCLPVFLFLFLMLPLPRQVEMQITSPLQRWATGSAVYCLEALGFSAWHEGNVIHIDDTMVAVAEACNGLRMLTAFMVVSAMVVLIIRRPWWAKALVLISSIPIAFVCNTARLALTAVLFTYLNTKEWERVFHDFGGFAMMPLALAIIALELWMVSVLCMEPGRCRS